MACDAGFISIVDPFLNPDGSSWTGSITYTLRYATTVAGAFIVNAEQQFNVSNGINLCLAPGLYTIVMQQSGFAFSITSDWGVPVSGGPYTVAEISSNVTLQGSFGAVTLTGTPSTGQVPTATSPTAATWQTPGGGGGGVTAVTGTAPVVSSGGATPAISVSQATSNTQGTVQPDNQSTSVTAGVLSAQLQRTDVVMTEGEFIALGTGPATLIPAQGAGTMVFPLYCVLNQTGTPSYTSGQNELNFSIGSVQINQWTVLGQEFALTNIQNNLFLGFAGAIDGTDTQFLDLPFTVQADSAITGTGGPCQFTIWWLLWSAQ